METFGELCSSGILRPPQIAHSLGLNSGPVGEKPSSNTTRRSTDTNIAHINFLEMSPSREAIVIQMPNKFPHFMQLTLRR